MRLSGSAADSPLICAGSCGGPMTMKSLYITRRREVAYPSCIHAFSAAGEWVRTTSPSPRAPCLRMSPLPATMALVRQPVAFSKASVRYVRIPLSCVVVVVRMTTSPSAPWARTAKGNTTTRMHTTASILLMGGTIFITRPPEGLWCISCCRCYPGLSYSGTEYGEQLLGRYINTILCSIVDTLPLVTPMLGVRPRLSPCVNYRTPPGPLARSGRGHSRPYPARPAPERCSEIRRGSRDRTARPGVVKNLAPEPGPRREYLARHLLYHRRRLPPPLHDCAPHAHTHLPNAARYPLDAATHPASSDSPPRPHDSRS